MKKGEVTGTGITLVTTKAGIPAAERNGFKWIETEFESPEPERFVPKHAPEAMRSGPAAGFRPGGPFISSFTMPVMFRYILSMTGTLQ